MRMNHNEMNILTGNAYPHRECTSSPGKGVKFIEMKRVPAKPGPGICPKNLPGGWDLTIFENLPCGGDGNACN